MRANLIFLTLLFFTGCASDTQAPELRAEAQSEAVRAEVESLATFAREGWHLPFRVRVFFSDADGDGTIGRAERKRQEGLALSQLHEVREAYRHSPFDLFGVDIQLHTGRSKRVKLDPDALLLKVHLPTRRAAPIPASALLTELAAGYRWERDGRWYEGERVDHLREALRRDLQKLCALEEDLLKDCRRLELLASMLESRRQEDDDEVVLAPSEAELARASQFRAVFAINRVLNTFARWRLYAVDPQTSLQREALTATYYARLLHETYLDWFLALVVGGRTKVKVWREDWWHRNPLYRALDSATPLIDLGESDRDLPATLPDGSVRALLGLRLDGDLRDAFEAFDELWATRAPAPRGPLAEELQRVTNRMAAVRSIGSEKGFDGFTAWKELWDARIKDTAGAPFYELVSSVAKFLGDTRSAHPAPAVSDAQLSGLRQLLQPGDIVLVRQDHYLSNAFLPGFWSHALLYLGPASGWTNYELEPGKLLGADPAVRSALPAYRVPIEGHPARVIEAVSEGVIFNSLEHAVQKDYVLVLRPDVSQQEVAAAIRRSLLFLDRPYDFDFDFASDDKLVCTELVYRAYDAPLSFNATREDPGMPGLVQVMGRTTMPANELARLALYMQENPEPRPHVGYPGRKLRVVALLDREEKKGPVELLRGQQAIERLAQTVKR